MHEKAYLYGKFFVGVPGERNYETFPVDSRNRGRSQKFSLEKIYRMVVFFFLSASKQKRFFKFAIFLTCVYVHVSLPPTFRESVGVQYVSFLAKPRLNTRRSSQVASFTSTKAKSHNNISRQGFNPYQFFLLVTFIYRRELLYFINYLFKHILDSFVTCEWFIPVTCPSREAPDSYLL